jgi:TRAP-type C4-dicarboxylate transport system substrate-binding protein
MVGEGTDVVFAMVVSSKIWDAVKLPQQAKFQAAADKAMDDYAIKFIAQEKDVLDFFMAQGIRVHAPDPNAFRTYARRKYLDRYGRDWPKDALESINAL